MSNETGDLLKPEEMKGRLLSRAELRLRNAHSRSISKSNCKTQVIFWHGSSGLHLPSAQTHEDHCSRTDADSFSLGKKDGISRMQPKEAWSWFMSSSSRASVLCMIKGTQAAQLVDYGISETSLWRSRSSKHKSLPPQRCFPNGGQAPWMGLWATRASRRCPCPWQRSWN